MSLTLQIKRLDDPDGHNPALLLKGDWIMFGISDGKHTGWGEASHSKNDEQCIEVATTLFEQHIEKIELELSHVEFLERETFSQVDNFIQATAVSGLNQALYALIAHREQQSCATLLSQNKENRAVPAYTTINRALSKRDLDDYQRCISAAIEQGFDAIKCAPFEKVTRDGDQIEQAQDGLRILKYIREQFPDLQLRVDFHERFTPQSFLAIIDEMRDLDLTWIEAPCPINDDYSNLRKHLSDCMALGELFYSFQGFTEIIDNHWADVIMPDVKHVGGYGPLIDVIKRAPSAIAVSPHNPSGPIATLASLHAAQTVNHIHSLELPLILDPQRAYYLPWLHNGCLRAPDGPAWGWDAF